MNTLMTHSLSALKEIYNDKVIDEFIFSPCSSQCRSYKKLSYVKEVRVIY